MNYDINFNFVWSLLWDIIKAPPIQCPQMAFSCVSKIEIIAYIQHIYIYIYIYSIYRNISGQNGHKWHTAVLKSHRNKIGIIYM